MKGLLNVGLSQLTVKSKAQVILDAIEAIEILNGCEEMCNDKGVLTFKSNHFYWSTKQ